jgi:hypothetical protein
MLSRLMTLFRKKADKWDRIGSSSYRAAVRQLRMNRIRRKAWDEGCHLELRDPNTDLCTDGIKGRFPDDTERYPPGCQILLVKHLDLYGTPSIQTEWWSAPNEDVEADDWQVNVFGQWEEAR